MKRPGEGERRKEGTKEGKETRKKAGAGGEEEGKRVS